MIKLLALAEKIWVNIMFIPITIDISDINS